MLISGKEGIRDCQGLYQNKPDIVEDMSALMESKVTLPFPKQALISVETGGRL